MRRFYLVIGWMLLAAIVVLSVIPEPPGLDFEHGDKVAHLAAHYDEFDMLANAIDVAVGWAAAFLVPVVRRLRAT